MTYAGHSKEVRKIRKILAKKHGAQYAGIRMHSGRRRAAQSMHDAGVPPQVPPATQSSHSEPRSSRDRLSSYSKRPWGRSYNPRKLHVREWRIEHQVCTTHRLDK